MDDKFELNELDESGPPVWRVSTDIQGFPAYQLGLGSWWRLRKSVWRTAAPTGPFRPSRPALQPIVRVRTGSQHGGSPQSGGFSCRYCSDI
jgi:hypothetical protein